MGEAWGNRRIYEALDSNASMVTRVRRQLVEEGLPAVLARKKRATPPIQPIFDGEVGRHARFAVGCPSLPLGVAVEVGISRRLTFWG